MRRTHPEEASILYEFLSISKLDKMDSIVNAEWIKTNYMYFQLYLAKATYLRS